MNTGLRYLSVCAGIEAATQAWQPLGWRPVAFSEIERFSSAVLAHHYPDVPNWGDMTKFQRWPDATIDLLVGGTPCQSFSVAGLRKGLDDPRGNLALTYLAIAERYRPRWLVWENVPGVLSSNGGRDFGSLLGAMAKLGYGFAYRVLDAQYVRARRFRRAVPQRRRRVFVVGHLGDWRRAAAVLFDAESLSGNPPPGRKSRQVAPATPSSGSGSGGLGTDSDCDRRLIPSTGDVAHCLNAEGVGRCDHEWETMGSVAIHQNQRGEVSERDTIALNTGGGIPGQGYPCVFQAAANMAVRRLTPRECERLQGFPDDYTRIPWRNKPAEDCPDGPRYKALGNSMAVNVMEWIGVRIRMVDAHSAAVLTMKKEPK